MGDLDASGKGTNFKRVLLNYDAIRAESADRCLFCLNRQQQMALIAILEPLSWKTRWYSPTNATIDTDWLSDFVAQLEAELMTDHCDIQTAIDNINTTITNINTNITTINTEITTINNSLTVIENNVTNIDIEVKNVITQNTNINIVNVITTFVSFSSNTMDTGSTEMYARYNALCAGLNDWCYTQAYRIAAANGVSGAGLALIVAGLSVGVNLLEGLVHSDNPGAYSATDLENAFTSAADMDAVICHMVTYLALLPVTFDNFKNALSTFSPANAYQTTISISLQAALAYYDAYTAFVMNQQSEFEIALAANPTDFNCLSCGVAGWCAVPQTWDLTALNLLPWVIDRGVLTAGKGIVGQSIPGDASNYGWDVSIYFPNGCAALNSKGFIFTQAHLPSGAIGNAHTIEFWDMPIGGGTPAKYNSSNIGPSPLTWPTATADARRGIPAPVAGRILYRIRLYTNTAYYANATSSPVTASYLTKLQFVV